MCPTSSCETPAQCERQALFAEVDGLLRRSCGAARCHGVLPAFDLLYLGLDPCDQRAPLVDVQSVEYDRMQRIAPGDPDNSWLMVKLTAPIDEDYRIQFTPDADWQPPSASPWDEIGFGIRMPPPSNPITDGEIELFHRWIEAGAPGPTGN